MKKIVKPLPAPAKKSEDLPVGMPTPRQRQRAENLARQLTGKAEPARSLVNSLIPLVQQDERTDIPRQIPIFKPPERAAEFAAPKPKPAPKPEPEPELTLF